MYRSSLLIGKEIDRWYGRANRTSDPGNGTLNNAQNYDPAERTVMTLSRAFKGHEVLGYFYGNDKRVDKLVWNADKIRVRSRTEKVGGIDCFVIDAQSGEGNFVLWIDPEHGYNIARGQLLILEGQTLYETIAKKGEKYYTSLDNVKFEQIEDIWVPVEADILYDWKIPGRYNYRETIHYKANEYKFNPDHDAVDSFESEDVQNGAWFRVIDENGKLLKDKYIWQDGELISQPDAGK
jgi:hypothetical protein